MMTAAIHLRNLTKRYANAAVVDALTIEVPEGSIYGFLGPNGAGKSTTIKMMTGMIPPDDGDAIILGHSIRTDSLAVKRSIGVVPDNLGLFEYLSIWEHLDLIRSLFDLRKEEFLHRSSQLLHLLDLADDTGKLAAKCSYGMRKKTCLAMALLPNPKVLILDEPFEGLDPVMTTTVKKALKHAARRGTTIFLTTHVLNGITDLVQRYGILRSGILVAQGSTIDLVRKGSTLEEAYLREFAVERSLDLEWLG
jgi:ABC-2 type transport system ATP-binding protein